MQRAARLLEFHDVRPRSAGQLEFIHALLRVGRKHTGVGRSSAVSGGRALSEKLPLPAMNSGIPLLAGCATRGYDARGIGNNKSNQD